MICRPGTGDISVERVRDERIKGGMMGPHSHTGDSRWGWRERWWWEGGRQELINKGEEEKGGKREKKKKKKSEEGP